MWGKRAWRWSREDGGGVKQTDEGDEGEQRRSFLETEADGDDGISSKNDLLLPHTAADILR